jgi:hypothetical protein
MGEYSVFSVQCSVGLWDNLRVKWRVIRIVLTGAVVVGAAVLLWPRGEREPVYQGKKLSEWIKRPNPVWEGGAERTERDKAIRAIGTNALPFLLRWINFDSPFDTRMEKVVEKLYRRRVVPGAWLAYWDKKERRADYSVAAFAILGSQASPAIPELVQLVSGTNAYVARLAEYALENIGTNAVASLLRLKNGPDKDLAERARDALEAIAEDELAKQAGIEKKN